MSFSEGPQSGSLPVTRIKGVHFLNFLSGKKFDIWATDDGNNDDLFLVNGSDDDDGDDDLSPSPPHHPVVLGGRLAVEAVKRWNQPGNETGAQ